MRNEESNIFGNESQEGTLMSLSERQLDGCKIENTTFKRAITQFVCRMRK